MKLSYYSNVKDSKLQKNISLQIASDIKHFEGKRIEITIQKLSSKRSTQQNRLWWLYMGILSKELGFTKEEIHEICKFKFLKKEKVDERTGLIFEYLGSTAALNKSDFADLVSELIRWAAENFEIVLPLPGEQTEFDYEE